jgi:hypothetical protein
MAGISEYRAIVKQLLQEYAQQPPVGGQVEMETIFDDTQDRYQLMAVGWQRKRRVHGCVIHIDIKADKVWLQHDSTDAEVAQELVRRGIPAENIVLGFQPEQYRSHSGFAVH